LAGYATDLELSKMQLFIFTVQSGRNNALE